MWYRRNANTTHELNNANSFFRLFWNLWSSIMSNMRFQLEFLLANAWANRNEVQVADCEMILCTEHKNVLAEVNWWQLLHLK